MELTEFGARCTVCNIVIKSKKPSNLKEHIDSKTHKKNTDRISQVSAANTQNIAGRSSLLDTRSHTTNSEVKINTEQFQFEIPEGKLSKPPSQDPSFKTTSSQLGGALNSDQFNMNTAGENMELKKEVQMLRQYIQKIEEKLELRSSEVIKLKEDLGGTNILQKQLREKEDENYKLKQKLHEVKKGSPVNPHKQCEALESQLRRQLKESEELSQATFEKLNQRIEELKVRLNKNKESEFGDPNSETDHQGDNFGYMEDESIDQDFEQEISDGLAANEEQKESDVTILCHYCKNLITGPPVQVNTDTGTIQMKGALVKHFKICQYFCQYQQRITQTAEAAAVYFIETGKQEVQQKLTTILKEQDQLTKCLQLSKSFSDNKSDFSGFLSDWKTKNIQSYPFPQIKKQLSAVEDFEYFESFSKFVPKQFHNHRGIMRRDQYGRVDITQEIQQNELVRLQFEEFRYRCVTCNKLLSCEFGWRKHVDWKITCGRTCICDVFSFGKYSHSLKGTSAKKVDRVIEDKELKKLEALIQTTIEKLELIQPEKFKSTLETKRDIQREDSMGFINQSKDQLASVEQWLASLASRSEEGKLQSLGVPICDAIVYPRCPRIFGYDLVKHDHELMLFLKSHKISVRTIGNTVASDPAVAFVYLLDSDNEYTAELMLKLQQSLDHLAQKTIEAIPPSEQQKSIIQTELSNLYIRQTDYTKDYLGFFIVSSLNKNFDVLRTIGKRIGMPFSEAHSQLFTSIQFQSFAEDASGNQVRVQRLKAYNKWAHLLLTTSFKAALSMGTAKLFKGPPEFHMNKLQPSFNDGLTRIELSSYYYSVQQWKNEALQLQKWNQTIVAMERALQDAEEQLIYKISFKQFWDSFWLSVDAATTIIDFQPDLWTIIYAYSSRSYLFTGHHTDKHAKSGVQLTFLQRFAGAKTLVRVNSQEKPKEFFIDKHGCSRQIPICSLNVKQVEENRIPIDLNTWFYHLSLEQLNKIYFTCENQKEFNDWFGQDSAPGKRRQANQFENQYKDDEQICYANQSQGSELLGLAVVDQNKREIKLKEKADQKEKKRLILNDRDKCKEKNGEWIKKGKDRKGRQRWMCCNCQGLTINKEEHACPK